MELCCYDFPSLCLTCVLVVFYVVKMAWLFTAPEEAPNLIYAMHRSIVRTLKQRSHAQNQGIRAPEGASVLNCASLVKCA